MASRIALIFIGLIAFLVQYSLSATLHRRSELPSKDVLIFKSPPESVCHYQQSEGNGITYYQLTFVLRHSEGFERACTELFELKFREYTRIKTGREPEMFFVEQNSHGVCKIMTVVTDPACAGALKCAFPEAPDLTECVPFRRYIQEWP